MSDFQGKPAVNWILATASFWPIIELYSAIFIAIKRPVVTGRNWPTAAGHCPENGGFPDSLGRHLFEYFLSL